MRVLCNAALEALDVRPYTAPIVVLVKIALPVGRHGSRCAFAIEETAPPELEHFSPWFFSLVLSLSSLRLIRDAFSSLFLRALSAGSRLCR